MKRPYLLILSSLAFAPAAWGAETPDAGQLLRERAPTTETLPSPQPQWQREPLPAPMKEDKSVQVTIQRFQVEGNSLLNEGEISQALASFLNRPLGFEGLQAAAAALANAYRAKGVVARTYLPEQTIRDGEVTIRVVEARFGGVKWDGEPPRAVSSERVEKTVAAQQQDGQPVSYDAIDRAVLLLEDLPGEKVQGSLTPGQNPGEVQLRLKMTDTKAWTSTASLSNSGSRTTGQNLLGVGGQWNSPNGMGDQATVMSVNSVGALYDRLSYSLPVGYDGFRLSTNVSSMRYWLGEEYEHQGIHGQANTYGLNGSYPLVRGRSSSLFATAGFEHKRMSNQQEHDSISSYSVRDLSAGLSGFVYDAWGTGGYNSGGLQVVAGNTDLSGSANRDTDAAGARTEGNFTKLVWQANRLQRLAEKWSLFAGVSGQLADSNLDSSERFSLGGASGLRAYPTGEASGAEGALATLELRWKPIEDMTLAAFTDNGRVRVNYGHSYSGMTAHNHYDLHGIGVSVGWDVVEYWQIRMSLAQRLGHNPAADANGNDNDGGRHGTMLWLSTQVSF